ncbi:MAG: type IV secretory system conjugative DNA transfer family protein [Oscillospiraceae bacterium]|nr:type IV secretory system conjugative DNA transfer family protein [Oscillospiraceae bacterium]MCL2278633.1 type IV secretory system conjugative DNA transfer family protein [Oscillospiraceae bacterium]
MGCLKLNIDNWKRDKAVAVNKVIEKYKNADMPLTNSERGCIYNYKVNNHVLVFGGSGAGKSRNYVIPNLLQAHSSVVVTDPKGEILSKTGYFLKSMGYDIRVLNLDFKPLSDHYNPFIYLHPEREGFEERVLTLIETIILNTDGGEKKSSSDPFWDKAEKLFLQALFFFVAVGFREDERNMTTVLWLISLLKIEEEQDNLDSKLDFFVKQFAEKFNEKDENGNVVREHIGVQQYNEFREKAAGKTAKSIVITAVARLAPFRTSEMIRIGSRDSMKLDRIGEEKTAIFVVVPPTDETFNFVAGMLFTQMFQELQYCAAIKYKDKGQKLPVPVRFILDEFANTCKIPNFLKILAYVRSFGIGISPILQSLDQAKELYEKQWGTLIDNCSYLLFLGSITHNDTLEYFSKLLGKGTYDKRTSSRSYGKSGSSSKSWDSLGRELLMPDEIRTMPKDKCLLIVSGRKPFYSDKFVYESHPNFSKTSDGGAPPYNHEPLKYDDVGKSYRLDAATGKVVYENNNIEEEYSDYEIQQLLSDDEHNYSVVDNMSEAYASRNCIVDFPLENQIKVATNIKELLTISKNVLKDMNSNKWSAIYDDIDSSGDAAGGDAQKSIIETLVGSVSEYVSGNPDIDENSAFISTITDVFDIISKILLSNSAFVPTTDTNAEYEYLEADDIDNLEDFSDHFNELKNDILDAMINSVSSLE